MKHKMNESQQQSNIKNLDNISLTAFRIIEILNGLFSGPMDDEEINERLINNIRESRNLSKDTICIYINTLRAIGCEISRPSKNNKYKYVLKSHPFKINMEDAEIATIMEVRKYISSLGDWKLVIEIDDLFNEIINIIDPESKNKFLSERRTVLCRESNLDNILSELTLLENYCKQNKDIIIIYNSPHSGEKEIYLNAEKLSLENSSFYLWGYSYERNETVYLRLDRIKEIKAVSLKEQIPNNKGIDVKYKLTGNSVFSFMADEEQSEKAIYKDKDELIIQAKVKNKFKFIQQMLAYGRDCTILSPKKFQKQILEKLKTMSYIYKL